MKNESGTGGLSGNDEQDLKNAFAGLNLPGATPMNTQIDEDS